LNYFFISIFRYMPFFEGQKLVENCILQRSITGDAFRAIFRFSSLFSGGSSPFLELKLFPEKIIFKKFYKK
jgi:hypothetical protein